MNGALTLPRVARLGLAQVAIGATVALMTSTLNRVMVIELGWPAAIPAVLVALHFAVQLSRVNVGHRSDRVARRTPWIIGGLIALASGGLLAVASVALMHTNRGAGLTLAVIAYVIIGFGVSAAGTALLAMVAEHVEANKLARAAAILWVMMIAGIAVTAGLVGAWLDPYSPERLVVVCGAACVAALVLGLVGTWRIEPTGNGRPVRVRTSVSFGEAFRHAWADARVRRFASFIFVSMLAYSAQDLILEPFGGAVFALTPGESTQLGGLQHGGVLAGMIVAAIAARRGRSLRLWAVGGCVLSGVAFALLAASPVLGSVSVLKLIVAGLGFANGAFAIGAIGTMMAMIAEQKDGRAGLHMGIFGAAQAIAYASGGFAGGIATDVSRALSGSAATAYASVFVVEAVLFLVAAGFAIRGAQLPTRAVHLESDEPVLVLMR